MLNNDVRVVNTGIQSTANSTNSDALAKANFRDTIALINNISTEDAAFEPALKRIKKRLNAEFKPEPADIAQLQGSNLNNAIVIKFPKSIFVENYSPQTAIEFLLKGFLGFVNASLTPKVKSEELLKHLEAQIAQAVARAAAAKDDEQILAMLNEAGEDSASINVGKELAKPSKRVDDTVLDGSDDTQVEVERVVKPEKPQTIDLRKPKDIEIEEKLGTKTYPNLAGSILRSYKASNGFHNAHVVFTSPLSKVNHNKELTALVLEKIINIFFWRRLQDYKVKPIPQADLIDLAKEIQTVLASNLRDYILETNQDDLAGQHASQVFLTEAIDKINSTNLLDELQNSKIFNLDKLQELIRNISLDAKKPKQTSEAPSLGTINKAGSSAGRGLGFRPRLLTAAAEISNTETIDLAAIEIETDFLELMSLGEYHSTKGLAESLSSAIAKDLKTAEDPFDGKISEDLKRDLTKAVTRGRGKKIEPTPIFLKPFKNLDELSEYLKALANALNSCESLRTVCSAANISPAKYALPYIMMNYLKLNPEFRNDFSEVLEKLDANGIRNFIGMKDTLNNLFEIFQRKQENQRLEKAREELNSSKASRDEASNSIIAAFTNNSNLVDKRIFNSIGKEVETKFARANSESFFMRLMLPNLAEESTQQLLNHDQDTAIKEIFYLVTGNILLSPLEAGEYKVFNSEINQLETLGRSELTAQYAKACRTLLSEFHPDNINRGTFVLTIIAKLLGPTSKTESPQSNQVPSTVIASKIGTSASSFIEDVKDLIQTGSGWKTEKFGELILNLRAELGKLKQSGFIPILSDFANNPEYSKRVAQKIIETKEQQKKSIEQNSLLVTTLSNIWRAISGSIPDSQIKTQIKADLQQLSA